MVAARTAKRGMSPAVTPATKKMTKRASSPAAASSKGRSPSPALTAASSRASSVKSSAARSVASSSAASAGRRSASPASVAGSAASVGHRGHAPEAGRCGGQATGASRGGGCCCQAGPHPDWRRQARTLARPDASPEPFRACWQRTTCGSTRESTSLFITSRGLREAAKWRRRRAAAEASARGLGRCTIAAGPQNRFAND